MRRVRPMLDGLEQRCVMSATTVAEPLAQVAAAAASNGVLSQDGQKFTYSTPQGTRVAITIQGRGTLEGTFVDSLGALNLRFGRTNGYSKIVSDVHGGIGRALLATVYSQDQATSGTTNSLTGIGTPVINAINLRKFDLIPGGTVNVTSGIHLLGLRSAGVGSQIQLRELPESLIPPYRLSSASSTTSSSSSSSSSSTSGTGLTSTTGNPLTSATTNNISNQYISNAFLVQTLAGSDGEFVSAGKIGRAHV